MTTVTFSQLRNQAKKYFDAVERGETIEVYRHGKPIATVTPFCSNSLKRWKQANPLKISGVSLSQAILEDREE